MFEEGLKVFLNVFEIVGVCEDYLLEYGLECLLKCNVLVIFYCKEYCMGCVLKIDVDLELCVFIFVWIDCMIYV